MAAKPFKEKELAKEKDFNPSEKGDKDKEVQKDKHEKEKHEKEKHEKDENKEKQEKEKSEKEKHEKEVKEQKEQKEQKEHKEQKDKLEKNEKHEKEKHEKEIKDRKDHKELAKEKHEAKEQLAKEKHEAKELETLPSSAPEETQAALSTTSASIAKNIEHKIIEKLPKVEKHEKEKFEKFEKHEKFEIKELEKVQFDGKDLVEGGIGVQPGDPVFSQRLAALEAAVAQLTHFIPENLRPDLSQGALKQEADVAKTPGEPTKPAGQGGTEALPKEAPPKEEKGKK